MRSPARASVRSHGSASRNGSALLLAILAVLVLTMLGVGLAYFSSTEDKISGNDKLQKEGFYAAETGLRAGEASLASAMISPTAISSLLVATPDAPGVSNTSPSPNTLNVKDGGYVAVLLTPGGAGTTARDVPVSLSGVAPNDQPFYSLYIRNNLEDSAGNATTDRDMKLNLLAVGYVLLPNGKRITKILEEQISAANTGYEGVLQKQGNSGGTGGL